MRYLSTLPCSPRLQALHLCLSSLPRIPTTNVCVCVCVCFPFFFELRKIVCKISRKSDCKFGLSKANLDSHSASKVYLLDDFGKIIQPVQVSISL